MKKAANMLVICAFISLPFSFWLATIIGQDDLYGTAGIAKYTWIFWCMIPIGVAAICIGIRNKNSGHILAGVISVLLLLLMGASGFTGKYKYDWDILAPISESSGVIFPESTKAADSPKKGHRLCQAVILDSEQKQNFEYDIQESKLWDTSVDPMVKLLLPTPVNWIVEDCEMFLIRNLESGEYHFVPEVCEKTQCIFIAYDADTGRFWIVHEFVFELAENQTDLVYNIYRKEMPFDC